MLRRGLHGFPTSSARFGHFYLDPGEGGSAPPAGDPPAPPAGDPPAPPAGPGAADLVSQGIELGQKKLLESLGVKSADELKGLLERGRATPPKDGDGDKDKGGGKGDPEGDISEHPGYLKLAGELGDTKRELGKLAGESERLTRMADEARREKVRAAAMAGGVGADQSAAFLALFGDRFRLGADGGLETLGQLADGTMAPLGQKPQDLIAEVLKDSQYLVATPRAGGVGSKVKKTSGDAPGGLTLWGETGESALDKRLSRGKK